MLNIIIKKWLEPYVLLEILKKKYEMNDLTFDGFSKNTAKQNMLKLLSENSFGLYMKNVNKFYIFESNMEITNESLIEYLKLSDDDFEYSEEFDEAISVIDLAKAEVSIIRK